MANITHGMDVEGVRRLGVQLQKEAESIQGIVTRLNGLVENTSWVGPDAVRFKADWPTHRGHLDRISHDLDGFGRSALGNAREQEQVSGH